MKSLFIPLVDILLCASGCLAAWPTDSPLIVNTAPTSPKPYVLPHMQGFAFYFQGQVGRVLVSNETSGGTFSLVVANSGFATPGAIHTHAHLMEAWLVTKGSVNLWANDEGRYAFQNDFHLFTQGNNHTYGAVNPDSELLIAFQPGGVEKLLLALGKPYNSTTNSPYDPMLSYPVNATEAFLLGPKFDTTFEPNATINLDFTNDTTSDGLKTWHVANSTETLPGRPTPYFISANNGPKFLVRTLNQVIQPLATGAETDGRFTVGTIALPKVTNNTLPKKRTFSAHQAFQVLEGQLTLTITVGGEEKTINLIPGDTAFVPSGTEFTYESFVEWTKFSAFAPTGEDCLVRELKEEAYGWSAPVWPINWLGGLQ